MSGAVLPGATISATRVASGTVVERVTDGEGRFSSRCFVSDGGISR